MEITKTLNLNLHALKDANELIRIYAYTAVCFFVPFLLGHPQELVGVIVNAMLITTALQSSSLKRALPVIFAPSIAVLSRGLIFGPLTVYLIYMIPFIWVGNLLLVALVRRLRTKNYWPSLLASAAVKSGFLFLSAFSLVSLALIPPIFLVSMGAIQIYTAVAGGMVAWGGLKLGILKRLGI